MAYQSEQMATYESWKEPIFQEIQSMNLGIYRGRGEYEFGDLMQQDSVMFAHFKRHPELSNYGLRLVVAPRERAVRQDLMIQVDRNIPSTFDVLLVHTSIVESEMSKRITRPGLREVLKFAPPGSGMELRRIDYKDIINVPNVNPADVGKALRENASGLYFAIYLRMLLGL